MRTGPEARCERRGGPGRGGHWPPAEGGGPGGGSGPASCVLAGKTGGRGPPTVPPRPLEPAPRRAARGARGGGRGHAPQRRCSWHRSIPARDASFRARPGSGGLWGPGQCPRSRLPSLGAGPPCADAARRLRGRGPAAPGRGGARRRFTVAPRAPVLLRVKHARRLLCESEQLNGLNESDDKDLIAIALPAGLRGAMRRHLGERFTKRGGGSSLSSARKLCTLQGGGRASPGPRPRGLALEGAPQP